MSIIKPGDPAPPPSVGKERAHIQDIMKWREQAADIVRKFEEAETWDAIEARELPPTLIDFVFEQIQNGFDHQQIRRQLGIVRSTDKAWKKILSALRQGFRVDGTAYLLKIGAEYVRMSDKMREMIMKTMDEGQEVVMKREDGSTYIDKIKGPTKELAGMIDAYNRLNQGFIKNGKDMGAFVDSQGKAGTGGGGVTIQVISNVQLPTKETMEAHRSKQKEKNQKMIEDAQILVEAAQANEQS